MSFLIVIPSRYQSTRLPGKPLIDICGIPMVVRTYKQCIKVVDPDLVVVATDDARIQMVCEANGIKTIMTSDKCLTGTDRVAEVALQIEVNTYINVQGDEPIFNPEDLKLLINESEKHQIQL
jgi:3-deoxy-manno-octulosonate cytidylyltransferase (CMP-KDO synthetase)